MFAPWNSVYAQEVKFFSVLFRRENAFITETKKRIYTSMICHLSTLANIVFIH